MSPLPRIPVYRRQPSIRLFFPSLYFLCVLCGFAVLICLVARPALAQENATHFINLNYWPADAEYHAILAYPDTAWTWQTLGLNPAKGCPPYRLRQRAQTVDYWRTPGIPEDQDWAQASQGNPIIPCYRGHAGTDIPAPSGTPVYAAADGVVALTELNVDTEGEGAMIVIDHHRTVAGVDYSWRVRYLHLQDRFPVKSGPEREGQLIGWMVNQGLNSHLHFEIQDFQGCLDRCIVNPWGPTYLWIDDDGDGFPDPAASVLAGAPPRVELLPNPDFENGADGWLPVDGTALSAADGSLHLDQAGGSAGWTGVQTYIPYSVRGGGPLALTLTLSNPDDSTHFAFVTLGSVRDPVDRIGCLYTLPPKSSGLSFTLNGRPEVRWANLVLTISGENSGLVVNSARLNAPGGSADRRTRCGSGS